MKYIGIDIGSTTIKFALENENGDVIYKSYDRHNSKVKEIVFNKIAEIKDLVKDDHIKICLSGSGGLGFARINKLEFIQEVFSVSTFIKRKNMPVDCIIELGGEDAKLIFFGTSIEERMNSTCAGGTGAFIDQMASLLNISLEEFDKLSLDYDEIYPVASRCGVYAKSDVQPLINQGAKKENICRSIYQAVVNQTIGGLAQGKLIHGNVMFLGGPITFNKGLEETFETTLSSQAECNFILPEDSEYYVAFGALEHAKEIDQTFTYDELVALFDKNKNITEDIVLLDPLFKDHNDYEKFISAHQEHHIDMIDYADDLVKDAYLGIDSGSTTTKLVLIDDNKNIIYQYYNNNKGNPITIIRKELINIYDRFPNINIKGACSTGYGEDLIKAGFKLDHGLVETIAHYMAAEHFDPNVDFIIDIGGQDMKCFKLIDKHVDSIILNESCSSGCGSFIETYADTLGYNAVDFAKIGSTSKHPVDLGTRCTVFMNSQVKQAQKNGASVEDIAQGLAISVVKNAIYKVLRVNDASELGEHIVVQGGTFLNNNVLKAFENMLGHKVTRPNIAGTMGAFGAALYSLENSTGKSSIIHKDELLNFDHKTSITHCNHCQNHCQLTINRFSTGEKFISGNRCERGLGLKKDTTHFNMYEYKRDYLNTFSDYKGTKDITIAIPKVLNFYDTLPLWHTFFKELGFNIMVSANSSKEQFHKGLFSIPSDTICYGAKLVHGHIAELIERKPDYIFYPAMNYNVEEHMSDTNYQCPVVAFYPEVIKNNVHNFGNVKLLYPYMSVADEKKLGERLVEVMKGVDKTIKPREIKLALSKSYKALELYHQSIYEQAKLCRETAKENNESIIVLVGRPYHIDEELNHGIDKMITTLGLNVLSEDSFKPSEYKRRNVLNQWSFHARMYNAADIVANNDNMHLIQLVSFGCGLDAVTSDEVSDILKAKGQIYTQLKIDEISNLGAARIRVRSLVEAINIKKKREADLQAEKSEEDKHARATR